MNRLKAFQFIVFSSVILLTASLLWFIASTGDKFNQVNNSWTIYIDTEIKIVKTLLSLNTNLGYGGMIHNFKNYVIRGDEQYFSSFERNIINIQKNLQQLKTLNNLEKTLNLITVINITIAHYEKQINVAKKMYQNNLLVSKIDNTVKVNDELAFEALLLLRKEIDKRSILAQLETGYLLSEANSFLAQGNFFSIPLIILMLLLIFYIYKIQKSNNETLKAHKWVDTILDTAPEPTICSNAQGEIIRVNKQAERMLGYSASELLKMTIEHLIPKQYSKHHPDLRDSIFNQSSHTTMAENNDLFALTKSGKEIAVAISLSMAGTDQDKVAIATIRDMTEIKETERKLLYQATHDALTDLINRREFESHLTDTVNAAKQSNSKHVLCFLDLDQFKVVNDTSGHIAGDELLKQISQLLSSHTKKTDLLARLGGDEFAIIMHNCSIQDALDNAKIIIQLFEDFQFFWEKKNFNVGVSIGIVKIDDEPISSENILKHADMACFAAKDTGRNNVHVYQETDEKLALYNDDISWVSRINDAIENNQFCLYIQEIKPTKPSSKFVHYEILIRMKDTDGSIIPPGAFLPTAERYNLISKIDFWVIDTTFRWLVINEKHFTDSTHFSINLSGSSIGDHLVLKHITDWFDSKLFNPSKIHFEVTETMAIANLKNANSFIHTLKEYGCGFSLDDFGSGLSSFAYLKKLNVDTLKIDGLFVRDIIDDPIDAAMVESINHIGQVMGMKTIAEFVENDDIANKLIDIGVDYLQGYGIHKPEPIDNILKLKH